jgi:hypothetical protein
MSSWDDVFVPTPQKTKKSVMNIVTGPIIIEDSMSLPKKFENNNGSLESLKFTIKMVSRKGDFEILNDVRPVNVKSLFKQFGLDIPKNFAIKIANYDHLMKTNFSSNVCSAESCNKKSEDADDIIYDVVIVKQTSRRPPLWTVRIRYQYGDSAEKTNVDPEELNQMYKEAEISPPDEIREIVDDFVGKNYGL